MTYIDLTHGARHRAVSTDPLLANQPGLLGLALQAAERAPAGMTAGRIVAETIERFWSNTDRVAFARASAKKWALRPDAQADPLAATDQTGRPHINSGWSKIIAAQHADDAATASGGPHHPHLSSFME